MERITVSIDQAKDLLSVGRTTIYSLLSLGLLTRIKVGRRTLVTLESIQRLASGKTGSSDVRVQQGGQ